MESQHECETHREYSTYARLLLTLQFWPWIISLDIYRLNWKLLVLVETMKPLVLVSAVKPLVLVSYCESTRTTNHQCLWLVVKQQIIVVDVKPLVLDRPLLNHLQVVSISQSKWCFPCEINSSYFGPRMRVVNYEIKQCNCHMVGRIEWIPSPISCGIWLNQKIRMVYTFILWTPNYVYW